MYLLA